MGKCQIGKCSSSERLEKCCMDCDKGSECDFKCWNYGIQDYKECIDYVKDEREVYVLDDEKVEISKDEYITLKKISSSHAIR